MRPVAHTLEEALELLWLVEIGPEKIRRALGPWRVRSSIIVVVVLLFFVVIVLSTPYRG